MLECCISGNVGGDYFFLDSQQKRLEFLIMFVKEDLGKMISSLCLICWLSRTQMLLSANTVLKVIIGSQIIGHCGEFNKHLTFC
jgi:hypothetical protein